MAVEGIKEWQTGATDAMDVNRLFTADHAEYQFAAWDGTNRSGYQPLDDKVLVLMDAHVAQTSGGVWVPEEKVERQSMASESGVLVALGPAAFVWNDELTRKWVGTKPEAGDRVAVERYSGQLVNGMDGQQYRLMSARCVGALMTRQDAAP